MSPNGGYAVRRHDGFCESAGVLAMTELSRYVLETLWKDGDLVLSRSTGPGARFGTAGAWDHRAPREHLCASREVGPLLGGLASEAGAAPWVTGASDGGPRRHSAGTASRAPVGVATVPSCRDRRCCCTRSDPLTGPHSPGRQSRKNPGESGNRPRLADRHLLRVALATEASTGCPGGDRRNTRLHGARTDGPYESLNRCTERSILFRSDPLP